MIEERTTPAPKKVLSTMPRAASSLVRVPRETKVARAMPASPVASAPASMAQNSRRPKSKKAKHRPGSAACETTSPASARRRNTAKHPNTPATAPSRLVPKSTIQVR